MTYAIVQSILRVRRYNCLLFVSESLQSANHVGRDAPELSGGLEAIGE
jgi:hypothetical protein